MESAKKKIAEKWVSRFFYGHDFSCTHALGSCVLTGAIFRRLLSHGTVGRVGTDEWGQTPAAPTPG